MRPEWIVDIPWWVLDAAMNSPNLNKSSEMFRYLSEEKTQRVEGGK